MTRSILDKAVIHFNRKLKVFGAGAIPPRAVSVNRLYPNDTLKQAAFLCHTSLFLSFEMFQK